jgi:hypothetical protein
MKAEPHYPAENPKELLHENSLVCRENIKTRKLNVYQIQSYLVFVLLGDKGYLLLSYLMRSYSTRNMFLITICLGFEEV